MPGRVFAFVCALIVAVILGIVTFPQAVGLERAALLAQIIAFRGVLVIAGVLLSVFAVIALAVSRRKFAPGAFLVVFALFAVANAGVLASRGFGGNGNVAASAETVTVLSWNTLGGAAEPETIARLALDEGADVIALAETTDETATRVAEIMGDAGSPMWSHTIAWSESLDARSTSLLVSTALGDYRLADDLGSTSVLPSVVAIPVDGQGPTIASVHSVSPIFGEMAGWRSDLEWVTELCRQPDVIAAGDFNATLDHLDLGNCSDAALQVGSAGVGTWPTRIPAILSAPIDHVVSTAGWRAVRAQVIETEDDAGSDHRPIVATLSRR